MCKTLRKISSGCWFCTFTGSGSSTLGGLHDRGGGGGGGGIATSALCKTGGVSSSRGGEVAAVSGGAAPAALGASDGSRPPSVAGMVPSIRDSTTRAFLVVDLGLELPLAGVEGLWSFRVPVGEVGESSLALFPQGSELIISSMFVVSSVFIVSVVFVVSFMFVVSVVFAVSVIFVCLVVCCIVSGSFVCLFVSCLGSPVYASASASGSGAEVSVAAWHTSGIV